MDIYKQKFTSLQNSMLRFLCLRAGTSINQRNLAQILGVSPTAIAKALPALIKEGFVKTKRLGKIKLIEVSLNKENAKTMQWKRAENLRIIYESGLLEVLQDKYPGTTIILFGSVSRGDDTSSSDIDIAVVGSKSKEIDLSKIEKLLERTININVYPSFRDLHKDLKENLCNGIVLSGGITL